jgi:hypothetical protein
MQRMHTPTLFCPHTQSVARLPLIVSHPQSSTHPRSISTPPPPHTHTHTLTLIRRVRSCTHDVDGKAALVVFVVFIFSTFAVSMPGMVDCWAMTSTSDHSPVGRVFCITTWLMWILGTFMVKYVSPPPFACSDRICSTMFYSVLLCYTRWSSRECRPNTVCNQLRGLQHCSASLAKGSATKCE